MLYHIMQLLLYNPSRRFHIATIIQYQIIHTYTLQYILHEKIHTPFEAFTDATAPCSSRNFIFSSKPYSAVTCRGVFPSYSYTYNHYYYQPIVQKGLNNYSHIYTHLVIRVPQCIYDIYIILTCSHKHSHHI